MTHLFTESAHDHTTCRNPATGEVLGTSPLTSDREFKQIMATAQAAQKRWARLPVQKRVDYMVGVRDYILDNAEKIAEVIARDNGKTRVDALSAEVIPAVMGIDYYARHARKFLKDRCILPGNILLANKISKIIRVPYGVIGIISPWNYPFAIPFAEVVMGLLAGNAVVLKIATQTQMVGRELEQCFRTAKLPEGIFAYVNIPGRLTGSAFLKNGIDKLFFTGSVTVGKQLMREASETLTPLVLELGGNDAMLVCEDADLYRAASGAVWAGLSNCGQSCGGVERIYVHEKVYQSFLRQLKTKVEALRVGIDRDFDVDLGCMTADRQVQTVNRHLEDALAKGARIFARSDPPPNSGGRFLPAYVLIDVHHDMLVMQEETFGPILAVQKVNDMDRAVALANDSPLGLTGSVWSINRKRAEKLGRRIEAGVITINDHLMSHGLAETPWGGFKSSGIGRTHGAIGFDEMTRTQVLVHDILPFSRQNMWWHPHGKKVYQGLCGAVQFLYGKTISKRIKGLWHLLKILPRYFTTR
ncbi:MAG: aldehyde dehydrogenase family protein [Proteobacteria bacterium]|nr:aldehyde dehydrogenase family protein [Pseudomonadota bacterium]